MNFRSLAFIAIALGAAVSSQAQVATNRMDAIWSFVDNRVSRQTDAWFDDGDYPRVIQLLVFEANYAPHDYDVVTNLGWMQENIEDWDAALDTYKLYWRSNPQDKDRALPMADFYSRRRQYDKIPAIVEPVLSLHPHPNNYRLLAHAYERMNKLEDAKRVWDALLAVNANDGPAKVNLARVEKKIKAAKAK